MTVSAIDRTPWWNSLGRAQWNTLLASNLGWLFDGYETYALIITVGVALRQLLEPAQFAQIPFYAGRLGHWRADCRGAHRLSRAQTHHDPRHCRLLRHVRAFGFRLELGIVCGPALSGWRRHRLRMGHGCFDRRRAMARPRPRQGRRVDAMRPWDRVLRCLVRVAVHRPTRAERLALHVPAWRSAGAAHIVGAADDP